MTACGSGGSVDRVARTLTDLTWPRRTERLLLRPPEPDDIRAVHAYRADEETARWLGAVARSVEEVAGRLLTGPYGLVVERDGAVVGDLMLRVEDAWAQREVLDGAKGAQAELGWVVAPDHRDGTWRDSLSYALLAEEWDADGRAVRQPPPDVTGGPPAR